jgi:hypothetical protein
MERDLREVTMSLQGYVTRMDDYSGELVQALAKLEIEKSRGTINKDEQIDFIRDLTRAVYKKDIHPWRSRCLNTFFPGLLLIVASRLLPARIPHQQVVGLVLLCLAIVALLFSAYCLRAFLQKKRRELGWLASLEEKVNRGGSIFD